MGVFVRFTDSTEGLLHVTGICVAGHFGHIHLRIGDIAAVVVMADMRDIIYLGAVFEQANVSGGAVLYSMGNVFDGVLATTE